MSPTIFLGIWTRGAAGVEHLTDILEGTDTRRKTSKNTMKTPRLRVLSTISKIKTYKIIKDRNILILVPSSHEHISAARPKGQAAGPQALFVSPLLFVYRFRAAKVQIWKFVAVCIFVHCLQHDLKFKFSKLEKHGHGAFGAFWPCLV